MISENDVVTIAKEYLGDLLATSEQHDENTFMSLPTENFHLNEILFSAPDVTEPAKYANYMNEYGLLCGLLDCIPNDEENFKTSALSDSLHANYKYILDNCNLLDTFLNDQEKSELAQAKIYLYAEDNTLSEGYQKYIEFKEEIYSLKEQLNSDQSTVSNLSEQERIDWELEGKKFLQDKIKLVEQKLLIEGQQTEVEKHIKAYERLQKKHPAILINDLTKRIGELKLNSINTIINGDYLPIHPSPPLHGIEVWQHSTVLEKEINSINKRLIKKGNVGKTYDALKQIDFEWCSVFVARDWFDSTFFNSNYWSMPNNKIVSQGERPNTGLLTSYIKRIVVSKNISYKLMVDEPKQTPKINTRKLSKKNTGIKKHIITPSINAKQMRMIKPATLASLKLSKKLTKKKKAKSTKAYSAATLISSPIMMKFAARNLYTYKNIANKQKSVALTKKKIVATQNMINSAAKITVPIKQLNLQKYLLHRSFITNINLGKNLTNKVLRTQKVNFNNPLILSFVCKRVPYCPKVKDVIGV